MGINTLVQLIWREISPVSIVGSKIIRALEIIRVEKLIPNATLENKYLSNHDF